MNDAYTVPNSRCDGNETTAALERIKAEAVGDFIERHEDDFSVKVLDWAKDRLAIADYLGEVLRKHHELRGQSFGTSKQQCSGCSSWPCPDRRAALALIAQLDGGQ